MHTSTSPGTTTDKPVVDENAICSVRLRVDNKNKKSRFVEGGMRLNGIFKKSLQEKTPLVSVITVCLNSEKTISQCMESVFQQTYSHIEYIIIDGESSDSTVSMIKQRIENIDYFVSEKDDGLYDAMNKGLSLCTGDYIMVLNSDDWYVPNCIELLVNRVLESGADYVSGLADYVDEEGKHLYTTSSLSLDNTTLIRNPLRHETMLVPKWIYNKYGPYETRFKVIADFHFIIKLFEAGLSHSLIELPLMCFRNTGVSSTDMKALVDDRRILMRELFPNLENNDLLTISDLQKLAQSDIELLLRPNALDKKFHSALLSFAMKKWSWKPRFFERNDPQYTNSDYFRVETFCTNSSGGAGIGSQRRVAALKSIGIDVNINALFVDDRYPANQISTSSPINGEITWSTFIEKKAFITRANTSTFKADEMFSSCTSVVPMSYLLPFVNRADIVHFHWVAGILDYKNLELLRDKPIVWTLADMAAFTGGCHYSQGCEGYTRDCSDCPLIGDDKNITIETMKIKSDAFGNLNNLNIVCPSEWLAERARKSTLFKNTPVHVIPNPVPFDEYYPINKKVAKLRLGLDPKSKYILFGAENITSARKGGRILMEVLDEFVKNNTDSNVRLLTFGKSGIKFPLPQDHLGEFSDTEHARLAYSAASVFAFPSKEDNSPLTVSESLACGTPVVSFPVGNVPDLVTHKENGYIAHYLDIDSFGKGLRWALSSDDNKLERSLSAVRSVRNHNNPLTSAKLYYDLYQDILSK